MAKVCERTCSELVGLVWEMASAGADIVLFSVGSVCVVDGEKGR